MSDFAGRQKIICHELFNGYTFCFVLSVLGTRVAYMQQCSNAMESSSSKADDSNTEPCASSSIKLITTVLPIDIISNEKFGTENDINDSNLKNGKQLATEVVEGIAQYIELNPQKQKTIHRYVSKDNYTKYINEEKDLSKCEICECIFISRVLLAKHTVNEHNYILKPYSCDFCKAPYQRFNTLKKHMSVKHINRRKFMCTTCYKLFDQRKNITQHVKIHKKNKCGKI